MIWLAIVIGIVGVLAGVVAVIYYSVPAHSLPSVLGKVPCPLYTKCTTHRVQRGEAAAVAAVVLLVIAVVIGIVARRPRSQA